MAKTGFWAGLRDWFAERQADRDHVPPRPVYAPTKIWHPEDLSPALRDRPLGKLRFVVFDTETTGLRPSHGDELVSVGAVRVHGRSIDDADRFDRLINPGRAIPRRSIRFHGITDDMVAGAPRAPETLKAFKAYAGDDVLVAHNAAFDMKFLHLKEPESGVRFDNPVLDTLLLAAYLEPKVRDHSLDRLIHRWDIAAAGERHSAMGDALATAEILVRLLERLEERGLHSLGEIYRATEIYQDMMRIGAKF